MTERRVNLGERLLGRLDEQEHDLRSLRARLGWHTRRANMALDERLKAGLVDPVPEQMPLVAARLIAAVGSVHQCEYGCDSENVEECHCSGGCGAHEKEATA